MIETTWIDTIIINLIWCLIGYGICYFWNKNNMRQRKNDTRR